MSRVFPSKRGLCHIGFEHDRVELPQALTGMNFSQQRRNLVSFAWERKQQSLTYE